MSELYKKKCTSKKSIRVIVIACFAFIITLNITWYIGAFHQYFMWHLKMIREPDNIDGMVVDDDGYCYDVHYPFYLNWESGNLSISQPLDKVGEVSESDGQSLYVSSSNMIIWMKPFYRGVDEIGVILVQGDKSRQIYLLDNETARYSDDQPYVDAGKDEINRLFRKAEEEWNIKMPWKN